MQQMGGPHQRVGRFLAGLRRLRDDEQLAGRINLPDERGLHLAQRIVGVPLERQYAVRRLQEGIHVLARAAALDLPTEVHGPQMTAGRIEHKRHHPL